MKRARDTLQCDKPFFTSVSNDVLLSKELKPNEKLVFIYLRKHAGSNGNCFPSLATLADESGLSKKTVQRCIDRLIELNVLKKQHRKDSKGFHSNIYVLSERHFWGKKIVEEDEEKSLENLTLEELKAERDKIDIKRDKLTALIAKCEDTKKEPEAVGTANGSCVHSSVIKQTDNITQPQQSQSKPSSFDQIKVHFQYSKVLEFGVSEEDANLVFDVIQAVLSCEDHSIRISKGSLPTAEVQARFSQLTPEDIVAVIDKYKSAQSIKNPRAYLTTMLHNQVTERQASPKRVAPSKPTKNSFNNFTQRNYTAQDFAELEKKLLGQ